MEVREQDPEAKPHLYQRHWYQKENFGGEPKPIKINSCTDPIGMGLHKH